MLVFSFLILNIKTKGLVMCSLRVNENVCEDLSFRVEHDMLGTMDIPSSAYYGIQTMRAVHNFKISGNILEKYPRFISALAMVKLAAAEANFSLGGLSQPRYNAINFACKSIMGGGFNESFIVDMIQGGAGTSTNMNINEVVANLGLEYLGHSRGDYKHLHPNSHVNMSQSTNDCYPTAVRVAFILENQALLSSLEEIIDSFSRKSEEFSEVLKVGRTQLQDAVPMTLGLEFRAFSSTLTDDYKLFYTAASNLLGKVNLGGTAIGTGINADPMYRSLVVSNLSEISGLSLKAASDLVAASYDMSDFVTYSGMLKRLAIKLSKISNDLRLLSSGPRAGFGEINLPPRQPGSSIMPGKVNPVIPEAVSQVAYDVIGNDTSVAFAAEAGQLQLNAMEPLIAYKIFSSQHLLVHAMDMLKSLCVDGISANIPHCKEQVECSIGVVTALNPYIGYESSTRVACLAAERNCSVIDVVREEGILDDDDISRILTPANMIAPDIFLADI